MQKNVLEYIENNLSIYKNKIIYKNDNKSLSLVDIYNQSRSIATGILENYNLSNKPIAVLINRDIDCLISYHGITYSGNIYVPIDVNQPIERIKKIFNTLELELILTNNDSQKIITDNNIDINTINIDNIRNLNINNLYLKEIRDNQTNLDPLYIIFTSGSTGEPKGVTIHHAAVIDYIEWASETFNFSDKDIIANQAPFYFDNSVLDIYITLKHCSTLFIPNEKIYLFGSSILQMIENNNITSLFFVPSVLKSIAHTDLLNTFNYKGIKQILFAGEVMPNITLNILRNKFNNTLFANLYGPTEITVDCTYYIVDRVFDDNELLPIGKACNNSNILIIDDNTNLINKDNINTPGEICVKGISLSLGYYNRKGDSDKYFILNPFNKFYREYIYKTGDIGYYNEFGEIIYTGRKDQQIKINGYRIELGEIDNALMQLNSITNAFTMFSKEKEIIVSFIESNHELTKKDIRLHLLKYIPKYCVPSDIIFLNKFPLLNNGKINKEYLKKML